MSIVYKARVEKLTDRRGAFAIVTRKIDDKPESIVHRAWYGDDARAKAAAERQASYMQGLVSG